MPPSEHLTVSRRDPRNGDREGHRLTYSRSTDILLTIVTLVAEAAPYLVTKLSALAVRVWLAMLGCRTAEVVGKSVEPVEPVT